MEKTLLLTDGQFSIWKEQGIPVEAIEFLDSIAWGTDGAVYEHKNTSEHFKHITNPYLLSITEEEKMLGCCLLTRIDKNSVRLRQMAVQNNLQGKGIGAAMMNFAENVARDAGYKKMVMHARKTAIGFYEKFGYKVSGGEFIELSIPHYIMDKKLNHF